MYVQPPHPPIRPVRFLRLITKRTREGGVASLADKRSYVSTMDRKSCKLETQFCLHAKITERTRENHALLTSSLGVSEDDDAEGRRWYALKI